MKQKENIMVDWLKKAVFYEIYPPSFKDSNSDGIGDIQGMIEGLDYIKETGFNAIWLNPWFESPFRDGGYDITDFCKVAPRYGTNADAKRFFHEAHKRDIKVILDLVIGHTAIEHKWFEASAKLERNEYSDRYIWSPLVSYRGDGTDNKDGYYISGWSPKGSFRANFFAVQPALNYGYGKVENPWEMPHNHPSVIKNREVLKDIMRFWLDLGCDGFRVDMASYVVKKDINYKYTTKFWQNIRTMFDKEYPEAVLVSEWFNPKYSISAGFHIDFFTADYYGGNNIFRNDDWLSLEKTAYKIVFTDQNRGRLDLWLESYCKHLKAVENKGYIGMFSGNHDVWRLRHYTGLQGMAVKLIFLLTQPGCPFVYYGDEIGMKYLDDVPQIEGGSSRCGSRTPMQWNHNKNLGFSDAEENLLYLPIDKSSDAPVVSDAIAGKNKLYSFVKQVLSLRNRYSSLQSSGKIKILHGMENQFPLVYLRTSGRQKILIALNPTLSEVEYKLEYNSYKDILLVQKSSFEDGKIVLQSEGFGIWKL